MFCENCGTKCNEDDKFCTGCGNALTAPPKLNSERLQNPYISQQTYQPMSDYKEYQENTKQNPEKSKKISPLVPVIVLELILLLTALYFAFHILKDSFSMENTSKQYFISLVNGDYDKAYSLLNIDRAKENEFINSQTFKTYMKNSDLSKVENYKYDKNFEKTDGVNKSKEGDNLRNTRITYSNKDEETEISFEIELIKAKQKKLLFFDNWKINSEKMIAKSYQIDVLEGTRLKIDKIDVPEKYKTEENGIYSYIIPGIFIGNHQVEILKEGAQTLKTKINVSQNDDQSSLLNLLLAKDATENLEELTVKNMKLIYENALDSKDFQALTSIFVPDETLSESIKQSYRNLVFNFNETQFKVEKVDFYNINTTINSDKNMVHISYDYKLYYTYTDPLSEEILQESYEGNNNADIYFQNIKGNWLQTGFYFPNFNDIY